MWQLLDKLSDLSQLVDKIGKRLADLEAENDALRADLKSKEMAVQSMQTEVDNLKEQHKLMTLTSSLPKGEHRKDVKLKINDMVREIDKCIALLNT